MFPDSCPGTSKYLEVHYACVSARNPGSSSARKIPPWMRKQIKDKPKKNKAAASPKAGGDKAGGVPSSTASSAPRKPILVTDKAAPTTTTSTAAPTTAKTTTQVVEVNSRRKQAPRINDLSSHR